MLGKLFVSYRADDEGSRYKNLLVGWSENPNKNFFDIKFEDTSIGISINSTDAYYIKEESKRKSKILIRLYVLLGKTLLDPNG
ncbi:hypothetical protein [Staphylococcus pseudintermedius]|uniref:hypothetical protein n=1 Tax=Staphylococcus pseudintermedius TaxID=283734 RepID=UPI001F54A8D2|nr:hypothetical protein [Staphylococcus pseudintermedius]